MTASAGCRQDSAGDFVLLEQLWEKPGDIDAFGSPLNLMGWPPCFTIARITDKPEVIVVNRWDEKAGLRTGCCTLPSYRRARSTDKKETGHEED